MEKETVTVDLSSAVVNLDLRKFSDKPVNFTGGPIELTTPSNIAVFLIRPNVDTTFCLMCIDIIWVSDIFSKNLREAISVLLDTPVSNISICASHTHGSPNIDPEFLFSHASEGFIQYVFKCAIEAVNLAYSAESSSVSLCYAEQSISGIAVNRRRKAFIFERGQLSRRAQNLPNGKKTPYVPLRLLVFRGVSDNSVKGILVNFACHPVADPSNVSGSDYPGMLREKVHSHFGQDIPFGFLQGFAGDLRPNLVLEPCSLKDWILQMLIGPRFRASCHGDSNWIAESLFIQLLKLEHKTLKKNAKQCMRAIQKKITIPLEDGSSHHRDLELTVWSFGELKIQFVSAEVLSSFVYSTGNHSAVMQVGYSNGMVGYVPGEKDFIDGGYEVDGSRKKFGLKSRISSQFSKHLNEKIQSVLDGLI